MRASLCFFSVYVGRNGLQFGVRAITKQEICWGVSCDFQEKEPPPSPKCCVLESKPPSQIGVVEKMCVVI